MTENTRFSALFGHTNADYDRYFTLQYRLLRISQPQIPQNSINYFINDGMDQNHERLPRLVRVAATPAIRETSINLPQQQ